MLQESVELLHVISEPLKIELSFEALRKLPRRCWKWDNFARFRGKIQSTTGICKILSGIEIRMVFFFVLRMSYTKYSYILEIFEWYLCRWPYVWDIWDVFFFGDHQDGTTMFKCNPRQIQIWRDHKDGWPFFFKIFLRFTNHPSSIFQPKTSPYLRLHPWHRKWLGLLPSGKHTKNYGKSPCY